MIWGLQTTALEDSIVIFTTPSKADYYAADDEGFLPALLVDAALLYSYWLIDGITLTLERYSIA